MSDLSNFPNDQQAEQFLQDPERTLPPNKRWSGGPEQPKDHVESQQRVYDANYNYRDKGQPLEEDELGPNIWGDAD